MNTNKFGYIFRSPGLQLVIYSGALGFKTIVLYAHIPGLLKRLEGWDQWGRMGKYKLHLSTKKASKPSIWQPY